MCKYTLFSVGSFDIFWNKCFFGDGIDTVGCGSLSCFQTSCWASGNYVIRSEFIESKTELLKMWYERGEVFALGSFIRWTASKYLLQLLLRRRQGGVFSKLLHKMCKRLLCILCSNINLCILWLKGMWWMWDNLLWRKCCNDVVAADVPAATHVDVCLHICIW